jgi:hypothetical protein
VLEAGGLRPGAPPATGTVTIGNDGDVPGRFTVTATDVDDVAGPNGGLLSEHLQLGVADVTDPVHPLAIFTGHPADFDEYDVGTLAPGEQRVFAFTAALPDGGVPLTATTGDNRYQDSSLSLAFQWRAGAATGVVVTPTPTPRPKPTPTPRPKPKPKPTPTPTSPPTATVSLADQLGLPPVSKCVTRSKLKFKLKAPVAGTRLKSAVIKVNGKTKLRLKGGKLKKSVTLKHLRKKTKLSVTARASNKKTYKASRTYRTCAKR